MGLAGVEAAAVATAASTTGAIVSRDAAPPAVNIYGNFEDGFWFDRKLYSVWVIANSSAEANRIATDTATMSCAKRSGTVRLERFKEWQERALFIPMKIQRFSYEAKFRCIAETGEAV
jgi:hypothetical protein